MKSFLKATYLCLLLVFFCSTAKAQREFIDSIHNMLIDLNEQIQYQPINQLLQRTISYCTGDTMNNSLEAGLKQLFSDDYFFRHSILQPVSSHLCLKYDLFIQRITAWFAATGNATEYQENIMRMAVAKINLARKERYSYLDEARDLLLPLKFQQPFLQAKRLYYLAITYGGTNQKPDSSYILYRQSLSENPHNTLEENIFYEETLYQLGEFCRTHDRADTAVLLFQQLLSSVKKIHEENNAR